MLRSQPACVRREVRWSFWVLRVIDICLTCAAVIATTWLHNSIHRNTSLATCLTPWLWDRHYFGNVMNVCCSWTFRRSSAPNRHCSASCCLPPRILHCTDWVVGQSWFVQGNIMCFLYIFFLMGKMQIYLEVFLGEKTLQNLDIARLCFVTLPLMERIKLKTNHLFTPICTI